MGKTFEQYRAEYARDPFQWPMPDGESPVAVPQPSLDAERQAVAEVRKTGNMLDGLRAYMGPDDFKRLAAAWGSLPSTALDAALDELREHFGQGNSQP